jgi:hypothetical protein
MFQGVCGSRRQPEKEIGFVRQSRRVRGNSLLLLDDRGLNLQICTAAVS